MTWRMPLGELRTGAQRAHLGVYQIVTTIVALP
jgi:hypothetical protein